jgi:hypothetical protein
MKTHTILTADLSARIESVAALTEVPPPAPAGFVVLPYEEAHESLPTVPRPRRRTAEDAYAEGVTVAGRTYSLSPTAQSLWADSLTILREAEALGAITASTPVAAVLGPVFDIKNEPVPSMSVGEYRALMLGHLMPRVAQIRAGQF